MKNADVEGVGVLGSGGRPLAYGDLDDDDADADDAWLVTTGDDDQTDGPPMLDVVNAAAGEVEGKGIAPFVVRMDRVGDIGEGGSNFSAALAAFGLNNADGEVVMDMESGGNIENICGGPSFSWCDL